MYGQKISIGLTMLHTLSYPNPVNVTVHPVVPHGSRAQDDQSAALPLYWMPACSDGLQTTHATQGEDPSLAYSLCPAAAGEGSSIQMTDRKPPIRYPSSR